MHDVTVRVVTDSTSDLPPEVVEDLGIVVVPLHIHFGEETYEDGVTISKDEFYRRLTTEDILPKTSAPSAGSFTEAYEALAVETGEIISIHISNKLSATYQSALLGKADVKSDCRIEVIDTWQASIGLGVLVVRAAELAKQGASLDEITRDIHAAAERTQFFGVLDTLDYLHKGGRIGMAATLLGSILHVKPILGLRNGLAHPIERVRGRAKALDRFSEMVASYGAVSSVALAYTTNKEEMEALVTRLSQFFPGNRIMCSQCGATLGTYLGPNTVCVGLIQEIASA